MAEGDAAEAPDVEPPVRPTVAEAREALRRHPWRGARHPFSDCYVCGVGRHDGLGLHFGDLPGEPSMTAALLVADATIPHDEHGLLPEIVWAALDCPSYVPAMWDADSLSLLARMQRRAARADPDRRADRGHRLAARRRGPQALHRVRAAERPTGACWRAPSTCGSCRAPSRADQSRSAARPLSGSAWIAIHSPAPTIVEQARDVAGRRADDREAAAVRPYLGSRAEQRTQAGGVAEVDVREVDEQARAGAPTRLASSRAHSSGAVAMSSSPATAMT